MANHVLNSYLVKGPAVNKDLIEQYYTELQPLISVWERTVRTQKSLTSDDAINWVEMVSDYAYALDAVGKYDYLQLAVEQTTNEALREGAMHV